MGLEVIILQGLPASGKSTWAREHMSVYPNFVRVNRDDIRAMLHRPDWTEVNETLTVQVRNTIIVTALIHGRSVIVDDTNLTAHSVEGIRRIVAGLQHDVSVKQVYLDTPVEECIRRDSARSGSQRVGAERIMEMYKTRENA